jgi:DNA-binding MarR family transcriptional regulator
MGSTGRMAKSDYERLAHFRYQLRRFLRFSEEATRKEGMTPLQYQLMLQIEGFPGRHWATIGELAERLQAKHHGVVSLVSRCEVAGLVERNTNRNDKRQVHVSLTREGAKRLARLARLHRAELSSLQGKPAVPEWIALPSIERPRRREPRQERPSRKTPGAAFPGSIA